MTTRSFVWALSGLSLLGLTLLCPWGRLASAPPEAKAPPDDCQRQLDELKAAHEQLAAEQRKLADQHLVLRKDHLDLLGKHEALQKSADARFLAANGRIDAVDKRLTDAVADLKRTRIDAFVVPLGQHRGGQRHEKRFPLAADTVAVSVAVQEDGPGVGPFFGQAIIETVSVNCDFRPNQPKECRVVFQFNNHPGPLFLSAFVIRAYR
jgi:hypothetical protein